MKKKPREVTAVEEFLKNPAIAPPELARIVGTTQKQLARMTKLGYARVLPLRAAARHEQRRFKQNVPGIERRWLKESDARRRRRN